MHEKNIQNRLVTGVYFADPVVNARRLAGAMPHVPDVGRVEPGQWRYRRSRAEHRYLVYAVAPLPAGGGNWILVVAKPQNSGGGYERPWLKNK